MTFDTYLCFLISSNFFVKYFRKEERRTETGGKDLGVTKKYRKPEKGTGGENESTGDAAQGDAHNGRQQCDCNGDQALERVLRKETGRYGGGACK